MNLPDAPIAHEGFFAAHFFTVSDQDKSKDFYVRVLGGKVIKPDNPCYIKLANTWIILNYGGGPTPDKPEVILETPLDLNRFCTKEVCMSQRASVVEPAQQSKVQPHQPAQEVFKTILSEDVDWKPFPAFPPSIRLAVVVGQPSAPGSYTIRVKVPHGEKLMPHKHPEDRVYTVISGVFYIGLGDEFDASKLGAYPPGAVVILPGSTPISTGRNPASTSRK